MIEMPRKRKSLSTSPKRRVSISDFSPVPSSSGSLPRPPAMSSNREEVFMSLCEMFPHLDPSLVEMVLSESKEVDVAISYLLELSTSAKESTTESTGFEEVASFLNGSQTESQDPENYGDVPDQIEDASYMDGTMCNDLDTLLDEALDRYGLNIEEDNALLHNAGLDHNTSHHTDHTLPSDQSVAEDYTCTWDSDVYETATKVESDRKTAPDPMLSSVTCSQEDVGIFEKPKEVEQQRTGTLPPKQHMTPPSASPVSHMKWNPMASSFYPTPKGNPSFIAPVVVPPAQWTYITGRREPVTGVFYNPPPPLPCVWNFTNFPQSHWNAVNIKPIKTAPSGPQVSKKAVPFVGKVLVLLRGAPGSGKSTLARLLLEQNPSGVILSTDDYFGQNCEYQYDISLLGEAHEWNHKRAKDAFEKNVSPIIIDNTNLQGWEMKPYVSMAMKHKYKVTFREPDTWWKLKPKELERRNHHGVKKEKIIKMLENFERVTVNSILNLSYPKSSKNADNSQRKADEKTGDASALPQSIKEGEMSLSETPESGNGADLSNASPDMEKSTEVSKEAPARMDPSKDEVAELNLKNVTATEGDNYMRSSENCSADVTCTEVVGDEQVPHIDGGSSLLSQRPELLDFVGDWPVDQTMSQRAPRSRKARTRHEKHSPVQKSSENDNLIDDNEEQTDKTTAYERIDNGSNEQDQQPELGHHVDSSVVDYEFKEHLLQLENKLSTLLSLQNMENCGKDGDGDEDMLVYKSSGVQEQVAGCTDGVSCVNEEVKMKPRHPRRNCRQCKLALNFTNHCPDSSSHRRPCISLSKSSQTEPQDFALAWRIERRNADILDPAKIILGKSSRFVSKSVDGGSEHIPYRVTHHKSTFVEEDDISTLGDEDGLDILSKLFRSVSFDVLKDLFERCDKDIVWTTNLLLDSGEKMHKDEECESEEWEDLESCSDSDKGNLQDNISVSEETSVEEASDLTEGRVEAAEYSTFVNALPLVVAEELKSGNVLSSNEINQGRVSTELQELFPNHKTITNTLPPDILWPTTIEPDRPNLRDSPLDFLQCTNTLKTNKKGSTEDISINHVNMAQKSDDLEILAGVSDEGQELAAVVEKGRKMPNYSDSRPQPKESLKFDYLELALPPEFAFQLTELFGPVGIDPGSLTIEDCVVPIDLKLAESIHKKWKESIMERQRQEALSYQLIFQDSLPDHSFDLENITQKSEPDISKRDADFLPFMDQWNTRVKKVSLRQIIAEEMALQAHQDSKKSSSSKNCAEKLKEKQIIELFPHVEQQLLLDIFKENNYSFEKTKEFMSSVLEADPVQNVIAQGFKPAASPSTDKSKEKKLKPDKEPISERTFQDLEYPNYDDFRAEAFLYHQKQQESYRKAAEAHNRGMKQVAAYYAQQGYLYGQKMKEENRRAAVQIFERANEYLLPENILDLHGLHVDEAMKHFRRVLQDKTDGNYTSLY
ncbi:hypothetical protein GDO81_000279 [Engystomops pustulosus]|uniref:NEDD4-binding protein 2 n=1 Tax=Engystomops pustulosus TaxID=76066 RepID=A0AAV7D4U1_ENGPU|nr:hypothetical protein GDO81_000279 [Engystomops pustulosus]KAG8591736.1 hypothetical protein GDO81_000279 [Engystomops pustulosus]